MCSCYDIVVVVVVVEQSQDVLDVAAAVVAQPRRVSQPHEFHHARQLSVSSM